MKIPILALILAPLAAFAIERPLHWTSDISRVADMRFDALHGDALDFKVDFNAHEKPVDLAGLDATLYWQTNGMGSAWWSAPGTISNSTARALFPSSSDPGDKTLNFYLALSDGSNVVYGASARVTFRNSPGLSPNMIAPPIVTIDFSSITVRNAPYYNKVETEAKIVELAPAPGDYATVSNAAMNAVQTETDPVWNAEKSNYATKAALSTGQITVNSAEYAESARDAYNADYATLAEGLRDGPTEIYANTIFAQLNAATATNALQDAAIAEKQDKLPYPTNAIPYAAISGKPSLATVATSGSYNDLSNKPTIPTVPTNVSAFNNDAGYLSDYDETDPTVPAWAKTATKPIYTASEVGAATPEELDASDRILYALVEGTNIIDVVTNYESAINIPERLLVQIDTNGERKVVWRESSRHNATIAQLTAALDAATNALANATAALLAAKADRAWGKYTSGMGADAPADTLWISHPNTVLAGGLDWMKNVTTGGDIFVLTSNGMALEFENNPTNAAFFNIASNGETIFRVEKTDERAVYVNISDVDVVGNDLLVGFQSWAWPTHPLLRVKEDLADAEWLKEEDAVDGEWAGVARFAWSGDGVNVPFVVSIENLTGGGKIFAGFSYTAPGETKIINNGVTDLSKGIFHNNKTYKWVENGTKLELVEQQ